MVIGISLKEHTLVGDELLQYEGAGADGVLVQAAFSFHGLFGEDRGSGAVGVNQGKTGQRNACVELDCISVQKIDGSNLSATPTRLSAQQIIGIFNVSGSQFAAVDGRDIVELDSLFDLELPGRSVDHFPAFSQVGTNSRGPLHFREVPLGFPFI